jgi:small-conductance mechanosensitive channel
MALWLRGSLDADALLPDRDGHVLQAQKVVLMTRKRASNTLSRIILIFFFILTGVATSPSRPFAAEEQTSDPITAPADFPGLQDVVPRASQLKDDLAQMTSSITTNVDLESLTRETENLVSEWKTFNEQVQKYGDFEKWPVNRLLLAQTEVERQDRDFGQMLDLVSEPLSAFVDIRDDWSARKEYWAAWEKELKEAGTTVPRDTFRNVDKLTTQALREIEALMTQLVKIQQRISENRDTLLTLKEKLNNKLTTLRQDPFKRNAHPLLHSNFFQQFNQPLWSKAIEGLKATFQFQGDFYERQGWLLGLQAVLFFIFIWLFRFLERATADRTEEWDFVFERPVAAAFFIATIIPQLLYTAPPPLLILTMSALAVFSASRLATALIAEKAERHYIYILAAIYVLSGILTVTGTPQPYQRLFLSSICLIGIPALFLSVRYQIQLKRGIKVISPMVFGALILLIVLIAELTGYVTFASHLIEATFGTILLLFLAIVMMRIGEGGIEFIFSSTKVSDKQFIQLLGKRARHRFKNLLRIIIVIAAGNYIFEVWGLAKRFENIWQDIFEIEFSLGEFRISLQMILLVIVVLYLTMLASWLIQAFIESQLIRKKRVDRGVRDAVKKLSHYALILIGFLVAMSMAGIDLKNFTILAGAFGIGIGFGLQDIVNNFVSGLILLFERPVKVGDTIVVGETWGIINNIGMRSTVVETWDKSEIIVPNSQMISEKVTNWTLSSNVSRLVMPIGVKYGTDMKKVLAILEQVASENPDVVDSPPPSAVFTEFGDSSLNFEIRVWIADVALRFKVRSAIGVAIADAFHAAGIEIPFPQRDLHLRSIEPGIMSPLTKDPTVKKPIPNENGASENELEEK